MKVYILGDSHGDYSVLDRTFRKLKIDDFIVHLGDLGLGETWNKLRRIAVTEPKFLQLGVVGGNHDDYEFILRHPPAYYLGDFGNIPQIPKSFFIRGARSIDIKLLFEGNDWWPEEELTQQQGIQALEYYEFVKPDYMFTHECPYQIIYDIHKGEPLISQTAELLTQAFEIHQPKYWFFGHHHVDYEKIYGGTKFQCINKNSFTILEIP